jgi:hypothetical protein
VVSNRDGRIVETTDVVEACTDRVVMAVGDGRPFDQSPFGDLLLSE